jgi:hypothetical protein
MAQPWPSGLQQFFSEENFSLLLDDGTIRSDMDIGPQKVRRRYTKGVDRMTGSIWLTSAQYSIFYTFYDVTLAGGTIPFILDHPITGVPTEFRFLNQPRISSIGGGNFQSSI